MISLPDWRVRDENALPDVPPGEEVERVFTPQTHVRLCQILVQSLRLIRLQVGNVSVPFKLEVVEDLLRTYESTMFRAVLTSEIAVLAGMDVRLTLRNVDSTPAKPRATLFVREEERP